MWAGLVHAHIGQPQGLHLPKAPMAHSDENIASYGYMATWLDKKDYKPSSTGRGITRKRRINLKRKPPQIVA
jgi:hypothetical protein